MPARAQPRRWSALSLSAAVLVIAAAGFFWFELVNRGDDLELPPSALDVRVRLGLLESGPKGEIEEITVRAAGGFHVELERGKEGAPVRGLDPAGDELTLALRMKGNYHDENDPTAGMEIAISGAETAARVTLAPRHSATFQLGRRSYRGRLAVECAGTTRLRAINIVPLEEYAAGVIGPEISASSDMEALKAQAVVTRTFAIHRMRQIGFLWDDTRSQVYEGWGPPSARVIAAVRATAGLVLVGEGKTFPAFYHSTCGGHTADGEQVYSEELAEVVGVPCDSCQDSPYYRWSLELTAEQASALAEHLDLGTKILAISSTPGGRERASGRWLRFLVRGDTHSKELSFGEFKKAVFWVSKQRLRDSLLFAVRIATDGSIAIDGGGWGHGVGLCQFGARGLAKRGRTFREILKHYFPHAGLGKLALPSE